MTAPKCTSWLGHKYQPRYDKSPAAGWPKFVAEGRAMATLMLDATRQVTYVHDVCVRCGHVVKRAQD